LIGHSYIGIKKYCGFSEEAQGNGIGGRGLLWKAVDFEVLAKPKNSEIGHSITEPIHTAI
jgi:hypothetical protein